MSKDAMWTAGRCDSTGKVKYLNRAAAKKDRKRMAAQGIDVKDLSIFLCLDCKTHHLGNKRIRGEVIGREAHRALHGTALMPPITEQENL